MAKDKEPTKQPGEEPPVFVTPSETPEESARKTSELIAAEAKQLADDMMELYDQNAKAKMTEAKVLLAEGRRIASGVKGQEAADWSDKARKFVESN